MTRLKIEYFSNPELRDAIPSDLPDKLRWYEHEYENYKRTIRNFKRQNHVLANKDMNDIFDDFEDSLKEYGKKIYGQWKPIHKLTFHTGKCQFCSAYQGINAAHIIEKSGLNHRRKLKAYKILLSHPANLLSACRKHHYYPYLDVKRDPKNHEGEPIGRRERREMREFPRKVRAFARERKADNKALIEAIDEDIERMKKLVSNLKTFEHEIEKKENGQRQELREYALDEFKQVKVD